MTATCPRQTPPLKSMWSLALPKTQLPAPTSDTFGALCTLTHDEPASQAQNTVSPCHGHLLAHFFFFFFFWKLILRVFYMKTTDWMCHRVL